MSNSRILKEWLDKNGNKITLNSNSSLAQPANDLYKDRFKKLAIHIEDYHKWSLVYHVSNWELDLEYRNNSNIYELKIDVNSKNIQIDLGDVDVLTGTTKPILSTSVAHGDWSGVLSILKDNNVIKDPKLCEWLDKDGKAVRLNSTNATQPAINNKSIKPGYYKSKFEKLLKHLESLYGSCRVRYLSDDVLKLYYSIGQEEYLLEIIPPDHDQYSIDFLYERVSPEKDQITRAQFDNYKQVLAKLFALGVIKDITLCEQLTSFADNFKEYENLWTEEK